MAQNALLAVDHSEFGGATDVEVPRESHGAAAIAPPFGARPPWSRRPAVAAALLVLLASAATLMIVPAKFGKAPHIVRDLSDPAQLWITRNLHDLTEFEVGDYPGGTLTEASHATFDKFMKTPMGEELDENEKHIYMHHFHHEVTELTKKKEFDVESPDHEVWKEIVMQALQDQKPVCSHALQDAVNGKDDLTFEISCVSETMTQSDVSSLCGRQPMPSDVPKAPAPLKTSSQFPSDFNFDPAAKWPSCADVINRVHSQGQCGSCWAFGALSSLDSRLCIATDGKFQGQLSRGKVTSCTYEGGDGCQGGLEITALQHVGGSGTPTGGSDGCHPYFGSGDSLAHFDSSDGAPTCPTECANGDYGRDFDDDHFILPGLQQTVVAYQSGPGFINQVKEALMDGGPLPVGVFANNPTFMSYSGGIYNDNCGNGADHAMAALGFGGGGSNSPYIVLMNSWGAWGMDGTGKMKVAECVIVDVTLPGPIDPAGIDHLLGGDDGGATTASTSSPAPGGGGECVTAGCAGQGAGKPCVFPFTYAGVAHSECTDTHHDKHWCATQVAADGTYMSGQWGECSDACGSADTDTCTDTPEDFIDGWGDSCEWYVNYPSWCDGDEGARKACCECGGGTRSDDHGEEAGDIFIVDSGPCEIDIDGCVERLHYENNEKCVIRPQGTVTITDGFVHTEGTWDTLTVEGIQYSHGTASPIGVATSSDIIWSSDISITQEGWKLCGK